MAAEVDLDAGDLTDAAAHADALAGLPFYRDEDHVAISRRLLVDALAGHFDEVVRAGERFRRSLGAGRTPRRAEPGAHVVRRCDGLRHTRR